MQQSNYQTGMHYPPPTPPPLKKQSHKLSRVKYQRSPLPRLDPDKDTKKIDQTPPTHTQETPPSVATRLKYTKKQKNLCKNATVLITQEINMTYLKRHTGTIPERGYSRIQE